MAGLRVVAVAGRVLVVVVDRLLIVRHVSHHLLVVEGSVGDGVVEGLEEWVEPATRDITVTAR